MCTPLFSFLPALPHLVGPANMPGLPPPVPDVHPGTAQHHIEVHPVDADGRVILDAQVDVLLDAEPEVAVLTEVVAAELVLSNLQTEGLNQYKAWRHFKKNPGLFQ